MGSQKYSYHNPNKLGSSPPVDKDTGCCSLHCLKFSLYVYNMVFLVAGLGVLGVGVWTILDRRQYLTLLLSTSVYDVTAYLLVAIGTLVVLVTVLGCSGISRESRCQIQSYSILLIVVLVLEASAGAIAYVYRDQVHHELTKSLVTTLKRDYAVDNATTISFDNMQQSLQCCGARAFDQDWANSSWWMGPGRGAGKVPDSCCKTVTPSCGVRDHPSNIYYTGCADQIANILGGHLLLIGSVAVGICVVELLGIGLSTVLVEKLRRMGP